MSIDALIRHELVSLLRRGDWKVEFTRDSPIDWRPGDVPNPDGLLLDYFEDH